MTIKSDPTDPVEFILERYIYNYKSQTVHWKSQYSEDGCGSLVSIWNNGKGYLRTKIHGKSVLAHHVVWILTTGKKPDEGMQIDHIDGNRSNNAHTNLRMVDQSTNKHNQSSKGYHWHARDKKWEAAITTNKKQIYLGRFDTEAEARAVYLAAKKAYGFIHR